MILIKHEEKLVSFVVDTNRSFFRFLEFLFFCIFYDSKFPLCSYPFFWTEYITSGHSRSLGHWKKIECRFSKISRVLGVFNSSSR